MKPSTGEIIAISANQIVPPKFRQRSVNVVLYSPDPLSSWRVEGGSGFETSDTAELIAEIPKDQLIAQLLLNILALCQQYQDWHYCILSNCIVPCITQTGIHVTHCSKQVPISHSHLCGIVCSFFGFRTQTL